MTQYEDAPYNQPYYQEVLFALKEKFGCFLSEKYQDEVHHIWNDNLKEVIEVFPYERFNQFIEDSPVTINESFLTQEEGKVVLLTDNVAAYFFEGVFYLIENQSKETGFKKLLEETKQESIEYFFK